MYLEVALQRYKKAARSFSPTSKAVLCDHIKTVNWRRTLNKFFKQRLQQLLCDCYRIRKEGSKFVTMFVGKFYNCVTNHQAHRPRPFVRDYLSREAILTRKLGVQSQTRLCRTRLKLFGPLHRCDYFCVHSLWYFRGASYGCWKMKVKSCSIKLSSKAAPLEHFLLLIGAISPMLHDGVRFDIYIF